MGNAGTRQARAKGLRAHAELAALAHARRDADAVRHSLNRARNLLTLCTPTAAADASAVTPNAAGWLAVAEAEYQRASGRPRGPTRGRQQRKPGTASSARPSSSYCRWRQAEALVTAGASRTAATVPLREAYAVATRLGATPLPPISSSCSPSGRGSISSPPDESGDRPRTGGLGDEAPQPDAKQRPRS